jgi:hypothetical protein
VAALALTVGAASAIPVPYVPALDRDVGVSTSTAPATAVVGGYALLSSIVVNRADFVALVSFTDAVPAGLKVEAATAGSGSCTTSGQTVACKMVLEGADSAPVNIVVTPTAAGTYSNSVSVLATEGQRDSNPGNDSASATLTVGVAPPAPACTVPQLRRAPVAVAKRLLGQLDCKPGKAKRVQNRGIAKGQVIRTTPLPGTYKPGKVVALTVSSGPAKAKRRGR